jgi:hypothetical protein
LTGQRYWQYGLGKVGKGSPVWADGKIYATEENGLFHILEPGQQECKSLDLDKLSTKEGRYAEIYGSPAIAYGRIYFTAESGLYCLGNKNAPFTLTRTPTLTHPPVTNEAPADKNALASYLQIVPAEVLTSPGKKIKFRARLFDIRGFFLREVSPTWGTDMASDVSKKGEFTFDKNKRHQAGTITASFENLKGAARVRVIAEAPWQENFESTEESKVPSYFVGHGNKFAVRAKDGNKMLVKPPAAAGLNRSDIFLGPSTMKNYAIQADMMGSLNNRQRPDMGLIAYRYTFDLMAIQQRVQIRTWAAELLESKNVEFKWEPDVWYTMKLQVEVSGNNALVQGKVWPRSEKEPEAWTITMEDALPNLEGSPGLYGYSPAEIYYDNIKIMRTK